MAIDVGQETDEEQWDELADRGISGTLDRCHDARFRVGVDGGIEQGLFALEVGVDRGLGEAGGAGNLGHRCGSVTTIPKTFDRQVEQAAARAFALGFTVGDGEIGDG